MSVAPPVIGSIRTLDDCRRALENIRNYFLQTGGIQNGGGTTVIRESVGSASISSHESTYNHANYNTAYGWGNHAGLYALLGHNHDLVYATIGHGHAHSSLSGIGANDHHNQAHVLNGGDHTVSGLTPGHFLKATGATTYGFGAHGLGYGDVGAAPLSHAHAWGDITSGVPTTWTPIAHDILSAYHGDATAASVVRGDIITGQGASPNTKWVRLAKGNSGYFFKAGADDAGWAAHGLTYSDVGAAASGHTHSGVYEPVLGNPATTGFVLSSTDAGVRSWIASMSNPMTNIGDLIQGGAAGAPARLADVTVGSYLRSGGVNTAVLWSTLKLPDAGTAFKLPAFTSTNTLGELDAVGATGEYLKGNTGAIPSWGTLNQAAVAGLTTASSPTFAGAVFSGLTASVPVVTTAGKALASQTYANFKTSLAITQADIPGLLATGVTASFGQMRVTQYLGVGTTPDGITFVYALPGPFTPSGECPVSIAVYLTVGGVVQGYKIPCYIM